MDSRIYSKKMIESMKSHLGNDTNKFITYPKFVFLCGAAYSENEYAKTNRGVIDKYLKSKSDDIFIVLSEKLWEDSFDSNIDLLTFEKFLAEVSDAIILFVESPGSFCELGAFAYAEKLFSDKLIIVIDEKYKGDKSFIITGPTAKAKKDGAKVIYAPLSGTGLLSSADIRRIVDEKSTEFASKSSPSNKRHPNKDEASISVNTFILELLELIKIVQPISRKDLIDIYKEVKGFLAFKFIKKDGTNFHNEIKYDYIIKLLVTVGLIKLDDNLISTELHQKSQALMFDYPKKSENQERNKLICRKYRYRGK